MNIPGIIGNYNPFRGILQWDEGVKMLTIGGMRRIVNIEQFLSIMSHQQINLDLLFMWIINDESVWSDKQDFRTRFKKDGK